MPRGASLTAEVVCLYRALEARRPAPERLVDDPYAERFLGPALLPLSRLPGLGRGFGPSLPLLPFEIGNFVVARHRYMDDALLAALDAGVEQVVILGAGYDTRAYRFGELLADRTVFEVDHPATQARKRELLARSPTLAEDAVRYVAVDFGREDFSRALRDAGFSPDARSLFIWEGVTMYLSRSVVESSLVALRRLACEGSELVTDFWSAPPGSGLWARVVRGGASLLRSIGEPVTFELPPREAVGFLSRRGWTMTERLRGRGLELHLGLGPRRVLSSLFVLRALAS